MAKLIFQVNPERVTFNDLIAMEEGLSNRASRDMLARFLTNGAGEYLDFELAKKQIGSLNLTELRDATTSFVLACNTLAETIVPEARGGN